MTTEKVAAKTGGKPIPQSVMDAAKKKAQENGKDGEAMADAYESAIARATGVRA